MISFTLSLSEERRQEEERRRGRGKKRGREEEGERGLVADPTSGISTQIHCSSVVSFVFRIDRGASSPKGCEGSYKAWVETFKTFLLWVRFRN